jgi:uncharacterized membrane protein
MPNGAAETPTRFTVEAPIKRFRLDSIDLLRGLVMVLMLLDHTREYFHNGSQHIDPTDLLKTNVALFLTRWITHIVAPVFVLLAGTGAYLQISRGKRKDELSGFLLIRGLLLIVLEFTIVRLGLCFHLDYGSYFGSMQVIWAIGMSMVVLAALVRLPLPGIAAVALVLIGGHNLVDGIEPASLGLLAPLWTVLHAPGPLDGVGLYIMYPLIPWIGVLAAGYALAGWLERRPEARPGRLLALGVAVTAGFVVLRAINAYGDPRPWAAQADPLFAVLSFLNLTKYPPSLLYLMMTLGPALLALAWLERAPRRGTAWLAVFGQVAFFYYIVHLYVTHSLAVGLGVAQGFAAGDIRQLFLNLPRGYGVGLPAVWAISAAILLALYPLCRWYAGVKQRGRGWWWSYL